MHTKEMHELAVRLREQAIRTAQGVFKPNTPTERIMAVAAALDEWQAAEIIDDYIEYTMSKQILASEDDSASSAGS